MKWMRISVLVLLGLGLAACSGPSSTEQKAAAPAAPLHFLVAAAKSVGHVFPRGTLREPVEGLRRAGAVVLSRVDLLDPARRADVWRTIRLHAPTAICAEGMCPRSSGCRTSQG